MVLGVMLLFVIIILSRSLYVYYLAQHQNRAFIRNASSALHSGAFDAASRVAERNDSPVAAMVATWVATVAVNSTTFPVTESAGVASRAFWRSQRKLTAKFIFGLGTLRSITCTAPFLGLAGACELILNGAFRGYGMERHAVMVMLTTGTATSLVSTITGLLVAMPAAWSYNFVRGRVELLDSQISHSALEIFRELNAHLEQGGRAEHTVLASSWHKPWKQFKFAQSRPLRKRFSQMPAYALLAAPVLAFAIAGFMIFPSTPSRGLSVRLLKVGEGRTSDNSLIPEIVIRSAGASANRQTVPYVNAQKTPWEKLDAAVKSKLSFNSHPIAYVEAEDDVEWETVVNAIDVVEEVPAKVILVGIASAHNRTRAQGRGKLAKH
jgi:biopolymer transport protein ExbB/TolQ/biopolymer transport protein ExbD